MGDAAVQFAARAVQRAAENCDGTACRLSGSTLCVIIPTADEQNCDNCSDEILTELVEGPDVQCSSAVWQVGDSGEEILARAVAALGAPVSA